MPRSGSLGSGIGIGTIPTGPARDRRGPGSLGLNPLEAIIVAMRPPGTLGARGALARAILGGIAATAVSSLSLAAGPPSSLTALPAAGWAALVGLALLICLGCGWLIESTAPGAIRRAGGLPSAFPLGGAPVTAWFPATGAAGIALPWLLGVLGALS